LTEVLDAEIGFEGLPFFRNVSERREEARLEPAHGMPWVQQVPMQFPGFNFRAVRMGKKHARFYRRPAWVLTRECLTPGFSRGGTRRFHRPLSAASAG
jgi:hypothetical protein